MKSQRRIYLDYASLTPTDPRVMAEVEKYSGMEYANPSSWYKEGVAAKKALVAARKTVANFLHALPDEIVFTSGGTESNNIAILGAVESLRAQGVEYEKMHILTSVIEHSSVRAVINYLNGKGVQTETIRVNQDGIVNLEDFKKKIKSNTVVVSIMTVNNEIGTIQPIREITKIIRQMRKVNTQSSIFNFQSFQYPIFHTDTAQAALYEDLNVLQLGVDLLTLDGSKIYGSRGVGILYIKRNTPITTIIYGGGQEAGMRSGTENVPAIMGLSKALEIVKQEEGGWEKGEGRVKQGERERIQRLKDHFLEELRKIQPKIKVNPSSVHIVSPHILNVSIPGINNEFFTIQLDARGVAVSTKSSCLRDEDESYVLKSIGADSGNSIRFSFGRWTDKTELKQALAAIKDALDK